MDLITPEVGLFVWFIFVLIAFLLPVLALISILNNNFKDNDKLIWVLVVLLWGDLSA